MEEYWCHVCKAAASPALSDAEILCPTCHNSFLERVEVETNHPRNFQPYRPSSPLSQLLATLLFPALNPGVFGGAGAADDQNLDNILHHIMMNDPNRYGPPPASTESLTHLPSVVVDQKLIEKYGTRHASVDECGDRFGEDRLILNCCVCRDEFELGSSGMLMPCDHIFHPQCLTPWLQQHNSCPTCRFELPTDDPDYEHMKSRAVKEYIASGRKLDAALDKLKDSS